MTHHELCILAAKWLHRRNKPWFREDGKISYPPCCKWVAVELRCAGGPCDPDVFGWGDGIGTGFAGAQIEVKMSHSDFLADKHKCLVGHPEFDLGHIKYYCCPEGVIKPEELPSWCGLLYEKNGKIEVVKGAYHREDKEPSYEVPMIASVMRRLEIKPQIFDFK